ncbi:MAG: adenylate/guanylate cyclase domain-containing protein [Candidatus Kapaibacteriota bacterium]
MSEESIIQIIQQIELLFKDKNMIGVQSLGKNYTHNTNLLKDLDSYSIYLDYMGKASYLLSDYVDSSYFFEEGIRVNTITKNKEKLSAALGNLGLTKYRMAEYSSALEYLAKAIQINEEIGNKQFLASNLNNIGNVFSSLNEYDKALEYHERAIDINKEIQNIAGIGANLGNIGLILKQLSKHEEALLNFQQALDIHQSINDKEGISISYQNIGNVFNELEDYDKALEYFHMALNVCEDIHNKNGLANAHSSIGLTYYKLHQYDNAIQSINRGLNIAREIQHRESCLTSLDILSSIYESLDDYKTALDYYKEHINIKDSIQSDNTMKKALLFDQQRKIDAENKERLLQIARMEEQEKLLYNILPNNIAERILKHESSIADYYPSVSVLFMDIVGFTELSSYLSPKQLVFLLDLIFTKADEILDDFGIEKIKTIGDGYLAVANLTKQIDNHEFVAASAAIQLLDSLSKMKYEIPADKDDLNQNGLSIQLRIGLHSGEVVAGIVGKNKFIFDLWGDVVNIASRMESGSEPGKIQISEVMAKQIEGNPSIRLVPRGSIEIKGKGMMQTYWLESNIITS